MGSQVLDSVDLSSLFQPGSINGGSFKKRVYIPASGSWNLYGGNVAQDQGEVSLVVIRVKYSPNLADSDCLLYYEYKGNLFPLKNLLFLSGKTLDHQKHHGWDLEPYNVPGDTISPSAITMPSPEFSPALSPQPTVEYPSLGGIIIRNPTVQEVELEILVLN